MKFSFNDHVLDDVAILLPDNRCSLTSNAVLRLASRFPAAVPYDSCDALEEEVLDYRLTPLSNFPEIIRECRSASADDLCTFWQAIGEMKTLGGAIRFSNLSKLAKCLLALPVSNAETERVFSMVRKIITDYRTEMDQSTLCALISCKLNSDGDCFHLAPLLCSLNRQNLLQWIIIGLIVQNPRTERPD